MKLSIHSLKLYCCVWMTRDLPHQTNHSLNVIVRCDWNKIHLQLSICTLRFWAQVVKSCTPNEGCCRFRGGSTRSIALLKLILWTTAPLRRCGVVMYVLDPQRSPQPIQSVAYLEMTHSIIHVESIGTENVQSTVPTRCAAFACQYAILHYIFQLKLCVNIK